MQSIILVFLPTTNKTFIFLPSECVACAEYSRLWLCMAKGRSRGRNSNAECGFASLGWPLRETVMHKQTSCLCLKATWLQEVWIPPQHAGRGCPAQLHILLHLLLLFHQPECLHMWNRQLPVTANHPPGHGVDQYFSYLPPQVSTGWRKKPSTQFTIGFIWIQEHIPALLKTPNWQIASRRTSYPQSHLQAAAMDRGRLPKTVSCSVPCHWRIALVKTC